MDMKKQEAADAYIDFLVGYEESEWPSQKVDARGKPNQLDHPPNPMVSF